MKIAHKIEYVDGDFDTLDGELVCSGSRKHGSVSLCFKANMHVEFASIKLFTRDRAVDADAVYDDAINLGTEIARRWNAAGDKR